jgi:hypothetical protein
LISTRVPLWKPWNLEWMVDSLGIVSAGSNVALLVGMNFSCQRQPCSKILVWKNLRNSFLLWTWWKVLRLKWPFEETLCYIARNAMGCLGAFHLAVFMKDIPKM